MKRRNMIISVVAAIMFFATCGCSNGNMQQPKQSVSRAEMLAKIKEYQASRVIEERGVAAQVAIAKNPNGPWIGKASTAYQMLQIIDPEVYGISEIAYQTISMSDNAAYDELIKIAFEQVLEEEST